ncbi:hypothetical protein BDW42DRAFT_171086 [Aspergillus taichungensis]|uniref:Uncharacterized protein n=1 Tax=Aspergillus taichungensis TaxID=482145 RepID=A0A2J5HSV8_9EURO|nr:hypothetical protein BDW42DRAFT_171086 [Aspergillus taichungensis]
MPTSRTSSDRSGSIGSYDSPNGHAYKTSLSKQADPNSALNEAQPMASLSSGDSMNGMSLRSVQHRDREGNIISEPDLANPTRYRFERPLDTIRAHEAAIDRRR